MSRSEHYDQVEASGRIVEQNYLPDIPEYIKYIWRWWSDMNTERPSSGMGASALSSKFMYDYLSVYSIEPMDIELQILKAIDQEYVKAHHDGQ